jgi:hypothetical protein
MKASYSALADQRAVLGELGVVVIDDDGLGFLRHRQCLFHQRGELAVDDQHLGFGVVEGEGEDGCIEPGVERVEDGTRHRHAVVAFEHGRRVGQHDGHGIALADATACQRRSELARAGIELGVGETLLTVDDGGVCRVDLGGTLEEGQRRQRLVIGFVLGEADGVRIGHFERPGGSM